MRATATGQRAGELLTLLGDPGEVSRELLELSQAARALSSDTPRFIDQYPEKWVAIHRQEVLAADDLDGLLKDLDERGISREGVIVRHITRTEHILIL